MKDQLKWACLAQGLETCAGRGLGFRINNSVVTLNCKKGGREVWLS